MELETKAWAGVENTGRNPAPPPVKCSAGDADTEGAPVVATESATAASVSAAEVDVTAAAEAVVSWLEAEEEVEVA